MHGGGFGMKDNALSGSGAHTGAIVNNVEKGVLESATSKVKSLQFATEAALTILRIDDLIKLYPEEEEG